MAKKVLVLSCASMSVIEKVMSKIDETANVTFLVQETCNSKIKETYQNAEIISLKENYFSYEAYCKNVKFTNKFDFIYIPSSTEYFWGFEEVFKIIDEINCKRVILFNSKGEEKIEDRNYLKRLKANGYYLFVNIYLAIHTLWYKCIGKKIGI